MTIEFSESTFLICKAILRARNHRGKTPEPGGGCNVERSRLRRAIH